MSLQSAALSRVKPSATLAADARPEQSPRNDAATTTLKRFTCMYFSKLLKARK